MSLKNILHLLVVYVILIMASKPVYASEVMSLELQKYCKEVRKAASWESFDNNLAQFCAGYIASSVDNLILIERLSRNRYFCLPKSLPTIKTAELLDLWIDKNKDVAEKTTAAVAIFAIYKQSFACQ